MPRKNHGVGTHLEFSFFAGVLRDVCAKTGRWYATRLQRGMRSGLCFGAFNVEQPMGPRLACLGVLAALQAQTRHDLVHAPVTVGLRHVVPVHLARKHQVLANYEKPRVGRGKGRGLMFSRLARA